MLPRVLLCARRAASAAAGRATVRRWTYAVSVGCGGLGRHAPAFAAQQVNGECFVEVVEREFVEDLDMPAGDAAFLALCNEWWERTAAWP